MASLEQRIAAIEKHLGIFSGPAEGTIPRGKYVGKTHESIVESDPGYVVFLDTNGHANGFGFTDTQIEEAQQLFNASQSSDQRHQDERPSKRPPW